MALTQRTLLSLLKGVTFNGTPLPQSGSLAGVAVERDHIYITLSAEGDPAALTQLQERIKQHLQPHTLGMQLLISTTAHKAAPSKPSLPHVHKIIVVASGKGGVGKSTVAALVAAALARRGLRVGLMDADVYGPSLPKLTGVHTPPALGADKQIIPHLVHGVSCMSMGYMIPPAQALIWRGPMVMGAIQKLVFEVDWAHHHGDLDVLVCDMPPGTGDAHLSLMQKVTVNGGLIVSTAHDLAVADALKGVDMLRKVHIPLLGLIENMSTLRCSQCGHANPLFTHEGLQPLCTEISLPYLGALPLSQEVLSDYAQGLLLISQSRTQAAHQKTLDAACEAIQKAS